MKTILLFDVDGTLVRTGGIGRTAMREATLQVFGDVHGFDSLPTLAGRTDQGILRHVVESSGKTFSQSLFTEICETYLQILEENVSNTERSFALPGVASILQELQKEPHIRMGLGTGNIEKGARIKLQDLSSYFKFGGFGCDVEARSQLVELGFQRGESGKKSRRVVIGDTLRDIEAARNTHAEVLAVATGDVSRSELAKGNPDLLVDSLEDPRVKDFLKKTTDKTQTVASTFLG